MNLKNFRLIATVFAILAIFSNISMAQKKSFTDIMTVQLKNMGPIINNEVVEGYYMFYKVDKADRKNNNYKLEILDANLEKIATKSITESKYMFLQEGTYNGKDIMLKFYDSKEREVSFRRYNADGTYKGKKTFTLTNRVEAAYYYAGQDNGLAASTQLFSIENKGFANFQLTKVKKFGYAIQYYPSEEGAKKWVYKSDPGSKEIESATYLASNDELLLASVFKKKGIMSKDVMPYVLGVDLNTGKKVFEKTIEDSKYAVQLVSGYKNEDTGNIELTGFYYGKEDKTFKAASKGLFFFVMDNKGEITTRKYISWAKDVNKVIASNEKGKLDDIGYMFFHKVMRNSDGKIFAIAEQYRKVADGAGIASAILNQGSGGIATAKLRIEDMFVFEFDKDFNLEKVEVFDKQKSSQSFPSGYGFVTPQLMAQLAKAFGGFDYIFTQSNKDRSVFSVGYLDYERRKNEKNAVVFGAITHDGEAFSTDKMDLVTKRGDRIRVFAGKPGYVMIAEYLRKEKKLDMRVEKINY